MVAPFLTLAACVPRLRKNHRATGSAGIGMYVACISRGRHVWEICLHAVVAPVVYSMIWFCVWGGVGLRQSRQAMELELLGETYFNNSAHFLADGSEFCYNVPQEDIIVEDELVVTNHLRGVSPVCKFNFDDPDSAAFNVMDSYTFRFNGSGYGPILILFFLLGNAVSFMSNTGAMSLMVDNMASTGRKNDHLARRVYWLVTAAVLATTLLGTGGDDALSAFQAAMIMCGLPCSILLCFVLQALLLMCEQAAKTRKVVDYQFPNQAEFTMPVCGGIFNVFEYCASCGKVNSARLDLGMGNATTRHTVEFVKGLVMPFVTLQQVLTVTYPHNPRTNAAVVGCYAVIFVVWISLCMVTWANEGLTGAAWTAFVVHGIFLAAVREGFRMKHDLRSNVIADVICSAILWPQVLSQMSLFTASAENKCAIVVSPPVATCTNETTEC
jgi:BCCT, betaine/carnitine/choline family transporter